MIMSLTVIKIVFLLNIFMCLTQAVSVRNEISQQNSLDESKFSSRNSQDLKQNNSVRYEQKNDLKNYVLDNFDHRYPDGSYEFRYELADGQARYERGYFIKLNNHKSLVVVGYYSYRMPDGKYITVFYNADQYGYRQNQAITRDTVPDLPRSIEVPEAREMQTEDLDVTTKKLNFEQISSTTRRHNF